MLGNSSNTIITTGTRSTPPIDLALASPDSVSLRDGRDEEEQDEEYERRRA